MCPHHLLHVGGSGPICLPPACLDSNEYAENMFINPGLSHGPFLLIYLTTNFIIQMTFILLLVYAKYLVQHSPNEAEGDPALVRFTV